MNNVSVEDVIRQKLLDAGAPVDWVRQTTSGDLVWFANLLSEARRKDRLHALDQLTAEAQELDMGY